MAPTAKALRRIAPLLAAGAAFVFAVRVQASAPSGAEGGRPVLRNFLPRDYEAHNQVFHATEGAEGLMYFAVYGNVLEFDGRAWRKIPVPSSWIRSLAPAPNGDLLVAATDDLGVCRPDAHGLPAFQSFLARVPQKSKPLGPVWSVAWHDQAAWFATRQFVLRFARDDVQVFEFPGSTRALLRSVQGELLLRRAGEGLYRWQGGRFEQITAAPDVVGPPQAAFTGDGAGRILLGTENGHFFHLTGHEVTRWMPPIASEVATAGLRDLKRLRDGSLVITTISTGLLVADLAGNLQARVTEARHGLVSDVTYTLCEDRVGGLWVTTYSGVSRLEWGSGLTLFDARNGRGPTINHGMARWHGRLYAGSNDGLYRLDPAENGRPAQLNPLLRSASMLNVRVDRDTVFATSDRGIYRLGPAGAPELILPLAFSAAEIIPSQTEPGRFFVGTTRGVTTFRMVDGRAVEDGFIDARGFETQSLLEEPDGTLWLGTTQHGYVRARRRPGRSTWDGADLVDFTPGTRGLPADPGWCRVVPGHDGAPLFSTGHGAFVADAKKEALKPAPAFAAAGLDGLYSHPIVAADATTLYAQVGSADALDELVLGRLALREGAWKWQPLPRAATQLAGYLGAYHLHYEAAGGREGILWVSGRDALVRVDVATVSAATPPPPVARVRVVAQRNVGRWGANAGTGAQPLRLAFSREPIEFTFTAPRFDSAARLAYQTRLRGYAEMWSDWSPRGDASFTNLSGGPFVFEVRARDGDGQVGPSSAFTFSVTPPWHRSDAAVAGYGVLLAAGVLGFVRWRLRRAERERHRLERLIAQRTEELRQAKDAADDANRAKSAFLANMSHELRTPLNGVIGYAQVLMKDRELSPKNRERIQVVQSCGEHLLRMINEVLDFSKIEAGRMELVTTPFHLPQLLRDIAAAASTRTDEKKLELIFDPAPNLPELVLGDPLKLRQVIDNLLGNAVKFTPRGNIRFGAEMMADEIVKLTVADTGIGIRGEDLGRLFQPFQQVVSGRPPEPGTGLGLAISKRIVELMGGTLSVESEPGRGSVFSFAIRLPVLAADVAQDRAGKARISGYGGRRRRVLVVDDVAINRQVLRDLLEPLGFELALAAGGADALEIAGRWLPDLVLLDLRMPEVDGFELARRLRAGPHGQQLKIIAMSASVLSFNRDDAFAAGCDDFLAKPFREDDLLARLGLALQLEWTGLSGTAVDSGAPFASLSTRVPVGVLRELLAYANRGEVAALRRRLADLRGDPLADTLDSLTKRYRMERIREILEQHTTPSRRS